MYEILVVWIGYWFGSSGVFFEEELVLVWFYRIVCFEKLVIKF